MISKRYRLLSCGFDEFDFIAAIVSRSKHIGSGQLSRQNIVYGRCSYVAYIQLLCTPYAENRSIFTGPRTRSVRERDVNAGDVLVG